MSRIAPLAWIATALMTVTAVLVTTAYARSEQGDGTEPPWEPELGDAVPSLFDFASGDEVYAAYGMPLTIVALLLALAVRAALRVGRGAAAQHPRALRAILIGWLLVAIGTIGDYWLDSPSAVDDGGFAVEMVGVLVVVVASYVIGVRGLRSGSIGRTAAWLALLTIPALVVLQLVGFANVPAGPMLYLAPLTALLVTTRPRVGAEPATAMV